MSDKASSSISLKLLVEKESSKVVFVEYNGDFVDVLLSFMTMPIGNIIRLAREYSLQEHFGCLNNIYECVENLKEEIFRTSTCKDILLRPQSAAELYCRSLKLDVVDSDTNVYYCCKDNHCCGPCHNALCHCGKNMSCSWNCNVNRPLFQQGVFVKPITRLMMTHDLEVKPISTMTCVAMLSKFEAKNRTTVEEKTINIGRCEVLKVLCCSLTTKSPFSEILLDSKVEKSSFGICCGPYNPISVNQPERSMDSKEDGKMITLKLIIHKSSHKALYVEAKEDFVNLIGSFLTYPLGFVFEKLPSLSSRGCLGNLYKSIRDFDVDELFRTEKMMAIVLNPKLPRGLALHKRLIPIEEASYPLNFPVSSDFGISSPPITGGGFFRGTSMYMVTDDLTIAPLSPKSVLCFFNKFKIPLVDIVEQELTMCQDEAMRLLEAALVSNTTLSDVFMAKELKQESEISEENSAMNSVKLSFCGIYFNCFLFVIMLVQYLNNR